MEETLAEIKKVRMEADYGKRMENMWKMKFKNVSYGYTEQMKRECMDADYGKRMENAAAATISAGSARAVHRQYRTGVENPQSRYEKDLP